MQQIGDVGNKLLNAANPGSHIVEIFPMLHNLPAWLAPWKRSGGRWFGETTEFFIDLINEVKETIVSPKFILKGSIQADACAASRGLEP